MPLDMMAGPPATGSGPPGAVGPPDATAPKDGQAALFAALLAQQPQPISVRLSQTKDAAEAKPKDKTPGQDDDADPRDPLTVSSQGSPDPAVIDWMALAAMQTPQPVQAPQSQPVAHPPVSGVVAAQKEVMDTASLSAQPITVQADGASSGLLPLNTMPPTQPVANAPVTAANPFKAAYMAVPKDDAPVQEVASEGAVGRAVTPIAGWRTPTESDGFETRPVLKPLRLTVPVQPSSVPGKSTFPGTSQALVLGTVPTVLPSAGPAQPGITLADLTPERLVALEQNPAPVIPTERVPQSEAMPSVPPIPAAALPTPAAAPPATALTPLLQSSIVSETTQVKTQTQIALQNAAVPANNTGKTQASQGVPVSSADGAGQADTLVRSASAPVPMTPSAVQPLENSAPKVGVAPGNTTEIGRQFILDDAPKGANRSDGDEDGSPADQDADGSNQGSTGSTALTPSPTMETTGPTAAVQTPVTATTDKPLTGAERAQVVRQTADGMSTIKPHVATTGQSRMTVQLNPKEWGELRVTVQLTPSAPVDGVKQTSLVAHVVAGSAAIKTALETQSADLNHALRQTGMHLERLTVTVQAPGADAQSGSTTSGDRSFGSNNRDQWQSTQSQTGNGGLGGGGSSSFASYSERQGGNAFQNPSASRSPYTGGEQGDTDLPPVSNRMIKPSAGFDQRV